MGGEAKHPVTCFFPKNSLFLLFSIHQPMRCYITFYILCCTILLLPGLYKATAQNDPIKALTVVPLKGQPSAVAMSVFEDSFGFIWLGTTSGILRYDG